MGIRYQSRGRSNSDKVKAHQSEAELALKFTQSKILCHKEVRVSNKESYEQIRKPRART